MTEQKAVEWLEKAIDVYEIFPIENDLKLEVFKIAAEAIKKQVPMEPQLINGRFDCPSCHNNGRALNYYCDMCGQKLDWGAEDG